MKKRLCSFLAGLARHQAGSSGWDSCSPDVESNANLFRISMHYGLWECAHHEMILLVAAAALTMFAGCHDQHPLLWHSYSCNSGAGFT